MPKKLLVFALLSLSLLACQAETHKEELLVKDKVPIEAKKLSYTDVTVAEARELIRNNPDLKKIDVTLVYASDYAPAVADFYQHDGSITRALPNLDPDAPYLIYSYDGEATSMLGVTEFIENGFRNIYRLDGDPGELNL